MAEYARSMMTAILNQLDAVSLNSFEKNRSFNKKWYLKAHHYWTNVRGVFNLITETRRNWKVAINSNFCISAITIVSLHISIYRHCSITNAGFFVWIFHEDNFKIAGPIDQTDFICYTPKFPLPMAWHLMARLADQEDSRSNRPNSKISVNSQLKNGRLPGRKGAWSFTALKWRLFNPP